jgi:hypothetical protein
MRAADPEAMNALRRQQRAASGGADAANGRHWYWTNPEARRRKLARMAAARAMRRGRIVRPLFCTDCNQEAELEMHHDDYAQPLQIRWLCKPCHRKRHRP